MLPEITSVQNPRIKQAIRLRESRGRNVQQRTLVDGFRELQLAAAAGVGIVECFVTLECDHFAELIQHPSLAEKCVQVSQPVMDKLAYGQRKTGLVAVIEAPALTLDELPQPGNDSMVVVLDSVEKPGNVGAVLRTADAVGAHSVLLSDPKCDFSNPNVIRASQGTVFSVPTAVDKSDAVRNWLHKKEFRIFAARVDGSAIFPQIDLSGRIALIFGNETAGLADAWSGVRGIRIPMKGRIDSLNVSIAAAVMLFEAMRQRG